MTRILYIGNKLNSKNSNVSSIDALVPLFESEGYTLYYASSIINKVLRLSDMLLMCLRCRNKVDFVIIDTYSTLNFYYALLTSQLCRVLKLKYIPSLNGGNLPKRLRENPRFCKLIFNNAYKNVSPSEYLKNAFEQFGYSNIIYIPNTIELEQYPFIERQFTEVKLFWLRAFSKIYNPSLAIKTLKALQDKHIKASLCMVGPDADGTLQDVKKLAENLGVKVTFTGKLNKPQWISLSKDFNIFINTTNFDNMPVSVIEVMALGLPVISTNVGGMPFLIKNEVDGLLIESNNEEQFVNAITEIINNPDKALKMAQNARQKVEQFDWTIVKKQWDNVLQ